MKRDPHQPLREDVRLLGQILGSVLKKQEGEELFELVEKVRSLAKQARQPAMTTQVTLHSLLQNLSSEEMVGLARAFSSFLNLSNFAESAHRVRRRRVHDLESQPSAQPGSLSSVLQELVGNPDHKPILSERLIDVLQSMSIGLTLTAHPTEVVRRTLLHKYHRIANALLERDRTDLTPQESRLLQESIEQEITSLWMTRELREQKPSPVDEAQGGLAIIEQILWDAIPQLARRLDQALKESTGKSLPLQVNPIYFDSWMGGDRDGNPSVTSEVTRRCVHLARWMAAELYYVELSKMVQELSMSDGSAELRSYVGDASEPYRAFLRPLREKMRSTAQYHFQIFKNEKHPRGDSWVSDIKDTYTDVDELLLPLMVCHRSLVSTEAENIAAGALTDLIRRVHVFHLSLVKLDLRQDSEKHAQLLSKITESLNLGSYENWDENKKIEFLLQELQSQRPLIPRDLLLDESEAETLKTFKVLAELPADSLGAYIISMARGPSDILAVELLQREAGVKTPRPVVPLFEQVEDLRNVKNILEKLFSLPWYLNHIQGKQEIMLGYSDSAKTAGRLTASWELYRAQEEITEVCHKYQIEFRLFHGRGGTVSRGGGPTFEAITSQPPGSIQKSLRVTEQGEMIQAKFGMLDLAVRNLELYISAFLQSQLQPSAPPLQQWRNKMQEMSNQAENTYRQMTENHPLFLKYFRQSTPELELGRLNIGSRPQSRKSSGELSGLRAIPWSFAWTQTRLHLPAWLGVEHGFKSCEDPKELALLQTMYREWPFFKSTVDLFEMVLAKSDVGVAALYNEVLVAEDLKKIGADLQLRLEQVSEQILKITGHKTLLETNSVLRRSIEVRNPYVDPLNYLQVELLKQIRCHPDSKMFHEALLITINGIAAGMRNTG